MTKNLHKVLQAVLAGNVEMIHDEDNPGVYDYWHNNRKVSHDKYIIIERMLRLKVFYIGGFGDREFVFVKEQYKKFTPVA